MIIGDPKAMEDSVGTITVLEGAMYDGIAQGYIPAINHIRTCHIWVDYNGARTASSINTETLIIRPRLRKM